MRVHSWQSTTMEPTGTYTELIMAEPKKILASTDDAKYAVSFIREHGSQILALLNQTQAPVNFPGLRPPIVAALLQPVSMGDEAQALVLQKATVQNAFRIDMYGYFQANNSFKFRLKGFTYEITANGLIRPETQQELFYTAPIVAKTATAEVLKQAMIATGRITDADVDVTIGNLVISPALANNQAMLYMLAEVSPPDRPTSEVFSFAGCWYLAFQNKLAFGGSGQLGYKGMALQILTEAGQPIQSSALQALISTATKLVPGNSIERVMDIHQTSNTGPLTGGTVVTCIDFPGIGYGIISAGPREFFIGSN